jgi:hypothetical protein
MGVGKRVTDGKGGAFSYTERALGRVVCAEKFSHFA